MGEIKSRKAAVGSLSKPGADEAERPPAKKAGQLEARKWFDALEYVLEYVLKQQGSGQAHFFIESLIERLRDTGIQVPPATTTPYLNTIPIQEEPAYPGDRPLQTT